MRVKHLFVLTGLLVLGAQLGWGTTYEIDPAHSQVGFRIRHIVSKTKGQFEKFSGSITFDEKVPSSLKADATIETTSVFTNNEKRDNHLRSADFFNAEKFPTMTFKSTKAITKEDGKLQLIGDLTLLGVTKPVTLDVEVGGVSPDPWGNTRVGFSAIGKLSRKDFGMNFNMPMDKGGVMLGDDVEIQLEVEGVSKKK